MSIHMHIYLAKFVPPLTLNKIFNVRNVFKGKRHYVCRSFDLSILSAMDMQLDIMKSLTHEIINKKLG